MKIAMVCQNYPPAIFEGGISHYSRRLARHLSAMGEDVVIIAGDGYCGDGSDEAISVMKFPGEWDVQTAQQMVISLSSLRIDTVNFQYSPVMYPSKFKFAWKHIASHFASTVSFHTLWGGSKLNYLVALRLLSSADGVIATNSEVMYLLKKYMPFFLKKTHFIPIGANIEPTDAKGDSEEIVARYLLDPNIPVLAYFGMLYPGKGMNLLFNAARILLDKYRLDFRLLVIGGGISDVSEYREEKRRLTSKLGVEDKVIWTGKLPAAEVSALLSRSEVVILPFDSGVSDRRGSLMAALAHHKAVVTTKPSVPVDLFKNGDNMIWPASQNADAFAKAIFQVLQDDALRRKLENGASDLIRHFEWSEIAEQTRAYFQDIIEKKKFFNR